MSRRSQDEHAAVGSGSFAVILLGIASSSRTGKCARRSRDRPGDRAGVAFLKETQADEGYWDERSQPSTGWG